MGQQRASSKYTQNSELESGASVFRKLLGAVFAFSVVVNLLALTGPIYMLQVYDRVLTSRSEETLLTLSLLVAFLFLMMGLLDWIRGRVLARAGVQFSALAGKCADGLEGRARHSAFQASDQLERALLSPAALALFDLLWTPLFVLAVFVFHPWLGYLALAGTATLCAIGMHQHWRSQPIKTAATSLTAQQNALSLGASKAAAYLPRLHRRALSSNEVGSRADVAGIRLRSSDHAGGYLALTKTLRLFLQSAMLGLGAFLVLQAELTAGAMIAASILVGRAFAPIEASLTNWPMLRAAFPAWRKLTTLGKSRDVRTSYPVLPRPEARIVLTGVPSASQPARSGGSTETSLLLEPGDTCGILGPTGSGKSRFLRGLAGDQTDIFGEMRLGGAPLARYDPRALVQWVGYLPQHVTCFAGTVAQNIAGAARVCDDRAVVEGARMVGAHDMILRLPMGYKTHIDPDQPCLSGGQLQRIGLARAFHGDPVLLLLDEPWSNLDAEGRQALNAAISHARLARKVVVLVSRNHEELFLCNKLALLHQSRIVAFGSAADVLRLHGKSGVSTQKSHVSSLDSA